MNTTGFPRETASSTAGSAMIALGVCCLCVIGGVDGRGRGGGEGGVCEWKEACFAGGAKAVFSPQGCISRLVIMPVLSRRAEG
jgi:hypothetical protein